MQKTWLLLGLCLPALGHAQAGAPRVEVVAHEDQRRVDVLVDGKPFTAYIYPTTTTLKKPTLYPLRTASGKLVTRGWPLEPRPGDRKSTRLNSSHTVISYAVFCLKKKNAGLRHAVQR